LEFFFFRVVHTTCLHDVKNYKRPFFFKIVNTSNPKWSRLEPASELPPARAGHCAAAYDGKVYM